MGISIQDENNPPNKPWHIRIGKYGRAFVPAPKLVWYNPLKIFWQWWYLHFRGYTPYYRYNRYWWSKPSKNQWRVEHGDVWMRKYMDYRKRHEDK